MAFKRKNSPYFWCELPMVDGRRGLRLSTGQTKKYLAEIRESELKKQAIQEGEEAVLRSLRPAPLLKDFANEKFLPWVRETNSLEPGTKGYYQNAWRLLADTPLAAMRLSRISNHECETCSFPGSASNANGALRTLRRMFSKAKELGLISAVPELKLRKEWRRSVKMTEADAALIAGQMRDGNARDAFHIIRATAMRPGEVFAMRWELLNLEAGVYCNPRGKTSTARRTVPLGTGGCELDILKRRHAEQGCPHSGFVFPSSKAKCGHLVTIHRLFTEARDRAGLSPSLVLYSARHGRLSDMSEKLNLNQVMQIGGHSDAKTALGYQHFSTEEIRKQLEDADVHGRVN